MRPLVERMVEQRRAHAEAQERQEELEGRIRGNGGGIPPATLADAAAEIERLERELSGLVDEIGEHGAEVKDIDEGLIDFPALRARRDGPPLLEARRGRDPVLAPGRGRLRGPPPAAARGRRLTRSR